METFRIGIDVGGTFTDLFVWSSDGKTEFFKVLSTPEDPSLGVIEGLKRIAEARGLALSRFGATDPHDRSRHNRYHQRGVDSQRRSHSTGDNPRST